MGLALVTLPLCDLPLHVQVEREAAALKAGEITLLKGYAKFARLLVLVKLNEAWREAGQPSFGAYILTLSEKYGRSTQQIYSYITAAEKLLPICGESGLDKMGISKAQEILRAARKANPQMSTEQVQTATKSLVLAALDESKDVAEIRAMAHAMFELNGEAPKGRYLDIGGFYVDDEQYKTFVEFCKVAMRVLGITPDVPQWLQRQRIIMFAAQEVLGTYAADVYGAEATNAESHR